MNHLSRTLFSVSIIAVASASFADCTSTDTSSRDVTGTIPAALTARVKVVRAIGVSGHSVNAPVVNGSFAITLPAERTVLVFVDSNNAAIANLRFARGAGGAMQSIIPGSAAADTIKLGEISIQGIDATSTENILTKIDCDDDGTDDFSDSDDDNDGIDDNADDDADGDGTIDKGEDLDSDDDGDCDSVDADDDNDGVQDTEDADDNNDGEVDTAEPDSDSDGVCNDDDADDDNDGIDDSIDDSIVVIDNSGGSTDDDNDSADKE
jgi:hypothetical protein